MVHGDERNARVCKHVAVAQWLSGASTVVKVATGGPCGGVRACMACVRRQRALWQPMAQHRRMAPLGTSVTMATTHGVTITAV